MPDQDPSAHRLPVGATIRGAALAIAKERKAFLKAIAVPTLVLATGIVAFQRHPEYLEAVLPFSPLRDLLPALLAFALFTMVSVSCHRLVILGVDSLPNAWGLFWSRRETRFLGWMYGIWIVAAFSTFLPIVLLLSVLGIPNQWLLRVPSLPGLYVLARLSLVLPRTAIDQRPTLQGSWRLSRSNGWRLAVVLSPAAAAPLLFLFLTVELLAAMPGIVLHSLVVLTVLLLWSFGMAFLAKASCWFTLEPSEGTARRFGVGALIGVLLVVVIAGFAVWSLTRPAPP